MKKSIPILCICTAAVLWGCIGVFYKQFSTIGFSGLQVVFLRVFTAAVFMAGYIFIKDRTLFNIRLTDLWMFIGTGVVSLAFFNYCYFAAIDETSIPVAATLLYTAPIVVMVLSMILFKENITLKKVICVILTVIGCGLVTGFFGGHHVTLIGLLFGFGSGIGYALYTIFGVFALRRYRTETVTFYTFLFATISVFPICDPVHLFSRIAHTPILSASLSVGIGFLACFMPFLLYTKGLQNVSPSKASMIATLEPVVACIIGVFFLHEDFTVYSLLGVLSIIIAIILLNLPTTNKERSP